MTCPSSGNLHFATGEGSEYACFHLSYKTFCLQWGRFPQKLIILIFFEILSIATAAVIMNWYPAWDLQFSANGNINTFLWNLFLLVESWSFHKSWSSKFFQTSQTENYFSDEKANPQYLHQPCTWLRQPTRTQWRSRRSRGASPPGACCTLEGEVFKIGFRSYYGRGGAKELDCQK